jgi:hypothetical protein
VRGDQKDCSVEFRVFVPQPADLGLNPALRDPVAATLKTGLMLLNRSSASPAQPAGRLFVDYLQHELRGF